MTPYARKDLKYSPTEGFWNRFCPAMGDVINNAWNNMSPRKQFFMDAPFKVAPPTNMAAAAFVSMPIWPVYTFTVPKSVTYKI